MTYWELLSSRAAGAINNIFPTSFQIEHYDIHRRNIKFAPSVLMHAIDIGTFSHFFNDSTYQSVGTISNVIFYEAFMKQLQEKLLLFVYSIVQYNL